MRPDLLNKKHLTVGISYVMLSTMEDQRFYNFKSMIGKMYASDSKRSKEHRLSHLALNLINYRKANGLTQQQLAEKIGVSWVQVSRWENRKHFPSKFVLEKLSELGVIED